jgi:hypothetical protein
MLLLHRLVEGALPARTFSLEEIEEIKVLILGGLVRADLRVNSTPSAGGKVIMATVFQITENGRRMAAAFPCCERSPTHIHLGTTLSVASASASYVLAKIGPPSAAAARRQ